MGLCMGGRFERFDNRGGLFVGLLVVGVGLVLLYHTLDGLNVGGIGSTTDIGGGLIALVGYALAVVGAVGTLIIVIRRHLNR